MSRLKGDLFLLGLRSAYYASKSAPRAGVQESDLLEQQAGFTAATVEALIDEKIEEALRDLQEAGYLDV